MKRSHLRLSDVLVRGSHRKSLASPVPSLLRSNDPPSEEELSLVQKAIGSAEASLKGNNGRDSELLIDFVRTHKAILASARRLPTELMVEIFRYYIENMEHSDLSEYTLPWALAHVCRRWRQVAINTPMLWKSLPPIRLVGGMQKTELKRHIVRLSTLLERSSTEPISFFLSKSLTPQLDDAILALLFEHSERWERISLDISEDVCAHFARVKGRLSSLSSLTLRIHREGRLHVDMFEIAPKLRDVNLASDPWSGVFRLPWSQLTDFTDETTGFDCLTTVLSSSAARLRSLKFIANYSWIIPGHPSDANPTTLPVLKSLYLQTPKRTDLRTLLNRFTAPALQDLGLRLFGPHTYIPEIRDLINRSGCSNSLRTLMLHTDETLWVDSVFKLVPFLTALDINEPELGLIEAISRLAMPAKSASSRSCQWELLPFLETLTIRLGPSYGHHSALNHLAHLRCDLAFDSNIQPQVKACSRTTTFRLASLPTENSSQTHAPWYNFAHFYPHLLGVGAEENDAPRVILVDNQLTDIKFNIGDTQISRKDRMARLARLIERFVGLLESFELSQENISYFYLKRIDWILQYLLERDIPMPTKIKISKRLEALFTRWGTVLETMAPNMKWGWQEGGYLAYIPENMSKLPSYQFFLWN
ncbi:hypothetical protein M413DRAFT_338931 [Hebeloma cylindrosporum]|uniref:F-box domain-containing protein n=1 Tax=Hebeloma cylindrosporum TaxID=76867 RepID=A0A0C2Y685_HEBCY|nr:hypothetical protein M413DRAFT_338931 [Hebeloma cylindrosporum h7]